MGHPTRTSRSAIHGCLWGLAVGNVLGLALEGRMVTDRDPRVRGKVLRGFGRREGEPTTCLLIENLHVAVAAERRSAAFGLLEGYPAGVAAMVAEYWREDLNSCRSAPPKNALLRWLRSISRCRYCLRH